MALHYKLTVEIVDVPNSKSSKMSDIAIISPFVDNFKVPPMLDATMTSEIGRIGRAKSVSPLAMFALIFTLPYIL